MNSIHSAYNKTVLQYIYLIYVIPFTLYQFYIHSDCMFEYKHLVYSSIYSVSNEKQMWILEVRSCSSLMLMLDATLVIVFDADFSFFSLK